MSDGGAFRGTDFQAGFFGKLPARGDFVRAGLPSTFVTPWDEWMSRAIGGSKEILGEAWLDGWRQAPIWHFALSPEICGPRGALGLWMPSMDRVGRNYPLMLAVVVGGMPASRLIERGAGFLDGVENAGLDALEHDLDPDQLAARVDSAVRTQERRIAAAGDVSGPSLWWTEGSPIVPPTTFALSGLPTDDQFAGMIDARINGAPES